MEQTTKYDTDQFKKDTSLAIKKSLKDSVLEKEYTKDEKIQFIKTLIQNINPERYQWLLDNYDKKDELQKEKDELQKEKDVTKDTRDQRFLELNLQLQHIFAFEKIYEFINKGGQEDANELILNVFELLDAGKFTGSKYVSKSTCNICNNESIKNDYNASPTIALNVDNDTTIRDCYNPKEEKIEQYDCDKCKKKVLATRITEYKVDEKIVNITLSNSSFDINSKTQSKGTLPENFNIENLNDDYKFTDCVLHQGVQQAGHYIGLIIVKNEEEEEVAVILNNLDNELFSLCQEDTKLFMQTGVIYQTIDNGEKTYSPSPSESKEVLKFEVYSLNYARKEDRDNLLFTQEEFEDLHKNVNNIPTSNACYIASSIESIFKLSENNKEAIKNKIHNVYNWSQTQLDEKDEKLFNNIKNTESRKASVSKTIPDNKNPPQDINNDTQENQDIKNIDTQNKEDLENEEKNDKVYEDNENNNDSKNTQDDENDENEEKNESDNENIEEYEEYEEDESDNENIEEDESKKVIKIIDIKYPLYGDINKKTSKKNNIRKYDIFHDQSEIDIKDLSNEKTIDLFGKIVQNFTNIAQKDYSFIERFYEESDRMYTEHENFIIKNNLTYKKELNPLLRIDLNSEVLKNFIHNSKTNNTNELIKTIHKLLNIEPEDENDTCYSVKLAINRIFDFLKKESKRSKDSKKTDELINTKKDTFEFSKEDIDFKLKVEEFLKKSTTDEVESNTTGDSTRLSKLKQLYNRKAELEQKLKKEIKEELEFFTKSLEKEKLKKEIDIIDDQIHYEIPRDNKDRIECYKFLKYKKDYDKEVLRFISESLAENISKETPSKKIFFESLKKNGISFYEKEFIKKNKKINYIEDFESIFSFKNKRYNQLEKQHIILELINNNLGIPKDNELNKKRNELDRILENIDLKREDEVDDDIKNFEEKLKSIKLKDDSGKKALIDENRKLNLQLENLKQQNTPVDGALIIKANVKKHQNANKNVIDNMNSILELLSEEIELQKTINNSNNYINEKREINENELKQNKENIEKKIKIEKEIKEYFNQLRNICKNNNIFEDYLSKNKIDLHDNSNDKINSYDNNINQFQNALKYIEEKSKAMDKVETDIISERGKNIEDLESKINKIESEIGDNNKKIEHEENIKTYFLPELIIKKQSLQKEIDNTFESLKQSAERNLVLATETNESEIKELYQEFIEKIKNTIDIVEIDDYFLTEIDSLRQKIKIKQHIIICDIKTKSARLKELNNKKEGKFEKFKSYIKSYIKSFIIKPVDEDTLRKEIESDGKNIEELKKIESFLTELINKRKQIKINKEKIRKLEKIKKEFNNDKLNEKDNYNIEMEDLEKIFNTCRNKNTTNDIVCENKSKIEKISSTDFEKIAKENKFLFLNKSSRRVAESRISSNQKKILINQKKQNAIKKIKEKYEEGQSQK